MNSRPVETGGDGEDDPTNRNSTRDSEDYGLRVRLSWDTAGQNDEVFRPIDVYNGGHSQSVIDNQMIATLVDDPQTLQVFADQEFQNLLWMANRSFNVPDIDRVLQERFCSEQGRIATFLAENLPEATYDVWIVRFSVHGTRYLVPELHRADDLQTFGFPMDCFATGSPSELSKKVTDSIQSYKISTDRVSDVLIWDVELQELRRELCKAMQIKDVANTSVSIESSLKKCMQILEELQQSPKDEEVIGVPDGSSDDTWTSLIGAMDYSILQLSTAEKTSRNRLKNCEEGVDKSIYLHIQPIYPLILLRRLAMIPYGAVINDTQSCLEKLANQIGQRHKRSPNNTTSLPDDRSEETSTPHLTPDQHDSVKSSKISSLKRKQIAEKEANSTKKLKSTQSNKVLPTYDTLRTKFEEWKTTVESGYNLCQMCSKTCQRIRAQLKNSTPSTGIRNEYTEEFVRVATRASDLVPDRRWIIVALLRLWSNIGKTESAATS